MLDPEISSLTESLVAPAMREHDEDLRREIRGIQQQMASRGLIGSGFYIKSVQEACSREVAARAQLIFNQLFRALNAVGFSPSGDLARDLKREFERLLRANRAPIQEQFTSVVRRLGPMSHDDKLEAAFEHAVDKFGAEIELAVASILRPREQPVHDSATMHFHGPVGAVLTGSDAQATVHQTITQEDRDALRAALRRVREDAATSESLQDETRTDLPDVIADVETEIDKERPNLLRLKAGALAITTSIQTVGALQPAYAALRSALLPFGITLP